jgi:hypothetical protein
MSVITQLSYGANGPLILTLLDLNTQEEHELHAVDLEATNVLAIDSRSRDEHLSISVWTNATTSFAWKVSVQPHIPHSLWTQDPLNSNSP